jgi:magnesium-transporting ATPase (P-type)
VVLYSFYKNVCMKIILFLYTFYSGYSGQSLFDSNVHSAYNLILAWPVIAMGVFDSDVSPQFLLDNKIMYSTGRKRSDLCISIVLEEMTQAAVDATIIFFIPYASYSEAQDIWTSTGYGDGLWVFGTIVYTILGKYLLSCWAAVCGDCIFYGLLCNVCLFAVLAMFGRIANLTYTWTVWTHLAFWGSGALYVLFLATYQVTCL